MPLAHIETISTLLHISGAEKPPGDGRHASQSRSLSTVVLGVPATSNVY